MKMATLFIFYTENKIWRSTELKCYCNYEVDEMKLADIRNKSFFASTGIFQFFETKLSTFKKISPKTVTKLFFTGFLIVTETTWFLFF